jgi:methionyl-tRNA formyltransferase
MRIIFMGSAAFAVPCLGALHKSRHTVIEVVSQTDKPAGRGQRVTPCKVAQYAEEHGLPLYRPKGLKSEDVLEHFRGLSPDLIAIVAYGKILPLALIEIPRLGCVNVHSSLLPKYRGAAPINWAIVCGEKETGVTTMRINEEMDAGDILLTSKTEIGDDEDAISLHARLAAMGSALLLETIDGLERDEIEPTPQDHSQATYAPMIKKEDGHIRWEDSAAAIYNKVRGFKPWPGAYTTLSGKIFRIHDARPIAEGPKERPGTITVTGKDIDVACDVGSLRLIEVQSEGKKRMGAADFLCGHKFNKGDRFI